MPVVVFLKAGTTSWTVPADWPGQGKVECLGASGNGFGTGADRGPGGGGGAYAGIDSLQLTAGSSISCFVAAAGSVDLTSFLSEEVLSAGSGGNATATGPGSGGFALAGDVTYNGGSGGGRGSSRGGGGGGGGAGPNGPGANGGAGGSNVGGGSGGGANGGGAGTSSTGAASASGGHGRLGSGGGVGSTSSAGGNGVNGGGGGVGLTKSGDGGVDPIWTQTSDGEIAGPGGGGGGGRGTGLGGTGGRYGGGGGGGSGISGTPGGDAGPGRDGLIVITYEASGGAPVVEASSTASAAAASLSIAAPSGTEDGDLLLLFVTVLWSAAASVSTPAGWTMVYSTIGPQTLRRACLFAHRISGAPPASTTVSVSPASYVSAVCLRISGAGDGLSHATAVGTSTAADPPELATSLDGDVLWLAASHIHQTTAPTPPTGFTGQVSVSTSSDGARTSVARRAVEASSLNPPAFANSNAYWLASTIAIGGMPVDLEPVFLVGPTPIAERYVGAAIAARYVGTSPEWPDA